MRILFYFVHPAKFHLFREAIHKLKSDHTVDIIINSKDVLEDLVKNEKWKYRFHYIQKGLKFYYNALFLQNGRVVWRYPKVYPIDIHNQAPGIITFSNYISESSQYLDAVKKIIDWTSINMLDKNGYFYHRVYRFHRNKTSFIRWSQA